MTHSQEQLRRMIQRYREMKKRSAERNLAGKERVSKKIVEFHKRQPKYDNGEGGF